DKNLKNFALVQNSVQRYHNSNYSPFKNLNAVDYIHHYVNQSSNYPYIHSFLVPIHFTSLIL
ncbi:MAG: hypothetical protein WD334_09490, partial [Chitinophagales bacterium]